jgi:hypothetical protein
MDLSTLIYIKIPIFFAKKKIHIFHIGQSISYTTRCQNQALGSVHSPLLSILTNLNKLDCTSYSSQSLGAPY